MTFLVTSWGKSLDHTVPCPRTDVSNGMVALWKLFYLSKRCLWAKAKLYVSSSNTITSRQFQKWYSIVFASDSKPSKWSCQFKFHLLLSGNNPTPLTLFSCRSIRRLNYSDLKGMYTEPVVCSPTVQSHRGSVQWHLPPRICSSPVEHRNTQAEPLNTVDQLDASCSHTGHSPSCTWSDRQQQTLRALF